MSAKCKVCCAPGHRFYLEQINLLNHIKKGCVFLTNMSVVRDGDRAFPFFDMWLVLHMFCSQVSELSYGFIYGYLGSLLP